MPAKPPKPAASAAKRTTAKAGAAATPPEAARAVPQGGDSQRLMREAAWSRMFGRVESKNPFTR